jgi:hypothetical protein
MEAPCFCHAAVRLSDVAPAATPPTLDAVTPAGELTFAVLAHFDLGFAAPYLGA